MEILIFEEGLTKSFTSFEVFDLAKLGRKIIESPEDYIFILSSEEWMQWLKLYTKLGQTLLKTKTSDEIQRKLGDFAEDNKSNPLAFICIMSAHPKIGSSYKIGSLTQFALGNCCAIFFAREERVMERSEEVKREIFRFREEQVKIPPLS